MMVFWWIANIILVVAVFPVVIALLRRVLTPVQEIREYVDDVAEHGQLLLQQMDGAGALGQTASAAQQLGTNARRYATAVEQALSR